LAIAAVLTAIALLVVTRSFGHAELNLLANRVRRFAVSLLRRPAGERPVLHHEQLQLHGKIRWEDLWMTLTDFAELHELDGVDLMVNLPSFGEEYHGTWKTRSTVEHHEAWRTDIPLVVDGIRAGHVRLVGAATEGSFCDWMSSVIEGLRPFEDELRETIHQLRSPKPRESLRDSATRITLPRLIENVSN
jgi:UDP-GlcNAc:undecaprenyl-phosphate GlcNAc-1-phosphate transferase